MDRLGELMAEARGFMSSRVILTAAELDLFTWLDANVAGAREVAGHLGADERAVTRLLDSLVSLGLLLKSGADYRPSQVGARLSARHPESVLPMMLHLGHLWESWSHLTEAVREGTNARHVPVTRRGPDDLRAFIGAMHVVGRERADEIAAACEGERFRRLLDIGGGSGTYTAAFLRRNPELTAVLFDLPEVATMAEERLAAEGLRDRVRVVAGDFYADELPGGCDAALLSAIVHQNGPRQNAELFRKIHRALDAGGTLLVRDHVMEPDRTRPREGTLFALNMLVCTEAGDTYTFEELRASLAEAGFREVWLRRKGPRMDCVVEARK